MRTIELGDTSLNRIHIIGIGGAGMSAIATVLQKMGKQVTGSDLKQSAVTERLENSGIKVNVPHDSSVINEKMDLVVYSTAINSDNEELVAANSLHIPVAGRALMLTAICAVEKAVGVAGCHGKTTTTSMVTSIARAAGLNPSFMIGGDVNEIGTNAGYNKGSLMIVEADESDKTFLMLPLVGAIITNIEGDHLETYNNSLEELIESFEQFGQQIDGPLIICVDEDNARTVADSLKDTKHIITVGADNADWVYEINDRERGGISATLKTQNHKIDIELAVPGIHNVKNAVCAFALMDAFGVDEQSCRKGLASFGGVARRFQFRGTTKGITFIDDYAHLPTEIQATISAAKDGQFNKIIAIFQPHRYSRTQSLYKEFAESLVGCDDIGICDIYSAGEEPRPGITGALITDELTKLGHKSSSFLNGIEQTISFVNRHAGAGDVVLTLGAGDITMYSDIIQESMTKGQ